MSEYVWETFDDLFKVVCAQGRRVEQLEARLIALENKLSAREDAQPQEKEIERTREEPATAGV